MMQDFIKTSRGDQEAMNNAFTQMSQFTSMQREEIASLKGLVSQVSVCAQAFLPVSAFMSV